MPDTPDAHEEQQIPPPPSSRMSSNRTEMMILTISVSFHKYNDVC